MTNKSGKQLIDKDYKDLWRAVILQAIKDLTDNTCTTRDRASARDFLSGRNGALQDICRFIGEDHNKVIKWYYNGKWG